QFANARNSVILDDHNQRLATVTNNAGRILIPSQAIAPVMKEATVAIEDKRFYEHRGVDFVGIGRAVLQDVLHQGASQGASTITALISSPSGYDPRTDPQEALVRRNLVLADIEQQGNITEQEYRQYSKVPLPKPGQIHAPTHQSKAPYFTTWLRQQLVDLY